MCALRSVHVGPFSFSAEAGEIVVLRGRSGSGKTLLLRLLADLDPGEGEVVLDGRAREDEPAAEWRRRAVYVAAEPGWWEPTAGEHFAPAHREEAHALAEHLAVRADALTDAVARLSTGERQRLAIVRALVLRPALLLLDEPSAALDGEAVLRLEALLRERSAQGAIVLLASHDASQADRLEARTLRIVGGRLEGDV